MGGSYAAVAVASGVIQAFMSFFGSFRAAVAVVAACCTCVCAMSAPIRRECLPHPRPCSPWVPYRYLARREFQNLGEAHKKRGGHKNIFRKFGLSVLGNRAVIFMGCSVIFPCSPLQGVKFP